VRHGTSLSTSLGASCPSDCANGPTGSDQWDLVLCVPGERSRDILEVSVKARTATNIPVVEANKNAGRGMSAL
jgi:hypothetical protein